MRRLAWILAALVAVLALGVVVAYEKVTALESEVVRGEVHVIRGLGGNVGVLATERGAVVVDTMSFRVQGERIRELAERLGGGPVQAVVNTHYHLDHTHGNPGFAPGSRVVATGRTRAYLLALDGGYWSGEARETLPSELVEDVYELEVGGKTVRCYHLGRGHTDGDLVVLFVEDRVLHTGDLLFRLRYPRVDLEAGGSIPAWITTLDRVLSLDFDAVIPGHGPLTDRDGVRAFQDFLRELWSVALEAAREGWSLEETLERSRLRTDAGFGEIGVPLLFSIDRDSVLRQAWQEATGAVVPLEISHGEGAP